MAARVKPLTKRPATNSTGWSTLAAHYQTVSRLHLRQLFADDAKRGDRLAFYDEAIPGHFIYVPPYIRKSVYAQMCRVQP